MKKVILGLILTAAAVFALGATSFADTLYYGMCGDSLNRELYLDKGVLTISGTEDMYNYGFGYDENVPWSPYASSVQSLIINNGVTSIGAHAFGDCYKVSYVDIPDSVTSIDHGAFDYCNNLTDVYYDGGEKAWNNIDIHGYNFSLTDAAIHYNYTTPTAFPIITEDCIRVKLKMSEAAQEEASSGKIFLMLYNQLGEAEKIQIKDFADDVTFDKLDLTKGKAKIFIWESLETMRPLIDYASESFSFEEEEFC